MAFDQVMTSYVGHGTHAARPASPNVAAGVSPIYYETDTTNTFIYTGSAWAQINGGGGAAALSVSSKTANYTVTSSDDVILADATSGGFTVTLPTAVGWSKRITVLKIDSSTNAVTIGTTGGQTINGAGSRLLKAQFAGWSGISDNANWRTSEEALPLTTKGDLLVALAANDMQRLAAGSDGAYLQADSSQATGLKWGALPTQENYLGGDVTITTSDTFSGGPAVTCPAGTWLLHAHVSISSSAAAYITAAIYDGTNNIASAVATISSATFMADLALPGILVTPGSSTTYTVRVKYFNGATATVKILTATTATAGTSVANASHISAVRIG